jgi:hypothetical protein
LLPRTEIQLAICYRHHHFAPHHLALEVRVGIVFAGAVVPVLFGGFMRGKLFQPGLVVMVETAFVKIDQIYTKPAYPFR